MSDSPTAPAPAEARSRRLRELAGLFLKLGTTAFGGPAAHIAMMEDEVVKRRQWLTTPQFLDLIGAVNLIPGPNSTEMAIHIGYRRAGVAGLLVAGCCFILPATLIVGAIAWAYVRWSAMPQVGGLLYGIKPVIIAIIAQALWRLSSGTLRSSPMTILAIVCLAGSLLGVNELILLGAAGLAGMAMRMPRRIAFPALPVWPPAQATAAAATTTAAAAAGVGLWPLFGVFVKIGSVLFGSGYVLLAFLRADLVERLHWMSEQQLLDATAVGQFTPGPLFTTATFIGYLLAGPQGAAAATAGIFLPAFIFVAISAPWVDRIRQSRLAGAFLDGLNAASLALMAAVGLQLGRAAIVDWKTAALAAASAAALLRFKINSSWLVVAGGAAGLLLKSA